MAKLTSARRQALAKMSKFGDAGCEIKDALTSRNQMPTLVFAGWAEHCGWADTRGNVPLFRITPAGRAALSQEDDHAGK
ncbi:hypothetical protein V5F49_20215 [Xanthobacter sp. V3C-3]|uniref:hypothetical protein n=1 Tax=Xanthobacter lutulentifluminis TaxID=3119935 RepID=UPI00372925F8